MQFIYNLGILIFKALAIIISPFYHKARLWSEGQKNWLQILKGKVNSEEECIWMHCASLGEFEQGRPVIEAIKKYNPRCKVVLTFFSPSGYEVSKNYQQADVICYLPCDTPGNAEKFIRMINPEAAIFVKYEFWHNYISVLSRKQIPLYLISGIFRIEQHFFKWYGSFFREMLKKFTWIYVQDKPSMDLLNGIGIKRSSPAGDTRFDRVMQITGNARDIPEIEHFRGDEKLFLAGSSWKQDEEIIVQYINRYPDRMKWIFAPHEINSANIERLEKLIAVKFVRFSEYRHESSSARVMIIDNIGMLSSAYRYAYIAEVGGGFGKGIHNILEPACWGIPVIFGPNHKKFREAVDLVKTEGARTIKNYNDFRFILDKWISEEESYIKAALSAGNYVKKNTGATDKILRGIMEKDINRLYS
jgi:3-deoxy-D-manno-octulosonic-acid transferase